MWGILRVIATTAGLLFLVSSAAAHAIPEGGVDATPAFNAKVAAICASGGTRTLHLRAGVYTFATAPAPIPCALNLVGEGKGATIIRRTYQANSLLWWVRGTDQSGGSLRNLSIEAGCGTNGGIAVLITATPDTDGAVNSYNRHSFLIDNISTGRQCASSGSFDFGLYLDGSANIDGNPNSVPGIRGVWVDHSSFASTNTASIYLNKARGTDLHVECYAPLNGSLARVMAENGTQSVKLDSRNCLWSQDAGSTGMMFNGTYVGH